MSNIDWREAYRRLFGTVSLTEQWIRDVEYRPRRIWSTWPMLQRKLGRKKPSEYQVVSYAFQYWSPNPLSPTYRYLGAPFDISPTHHIQKWYIHFRDKSPLMRVVVEDGGGWDDYSDPYELVYWKYNAMADEEETHVDKILEEIVRTRHDWGLSEEYLTFMRDYYDPLRFLWHTFQMHSMYIETLSLSSTVTNVFTFMGMDHLRRAQRVAQRIKMLDIVYPGFGFGDNGRRYWEEDPAYQPAREVIERMLVAYDATEALVSFTLGVKYVLDEAFLVHLSELADRNGDHMLRHIHDSFYRDSLRHRDQVQALFRYAFEKSTRARGIVEEVLSKWIKASYDALNGLRPIFEEKLPNKLSFSEVSEEVRRRHKEYLDQLDIRVRLP